MRGISRRAGSSFATAAGWPTTEVRPVHIAGTTYYQIVSIGGVATP
jgi:hypothetical protein